MAAKQPEDFCPTCGHYIGEYRHGMSKVLISGLTLMVDNFGLEFASRKQIEQVMNRNQDTNLQKLKHWLFVEKMWDPEKHRVVRGFWRATQAGADFVNGKARAYETAVSLDDDFVRYEGGLVYAHEVEPSCWDRDDYLRERGSG